MLGAGLSAALISADALGVMRGAAAKLAATSEDEEDGDGVPDVFRRVYETEKDKAKNAVSKLVTKDGMKKVAVNARSWLKANPYTRGDDWYYYWLYGRERFESFLEILEGRRQKNPPWYEEGVKSLMETQDPKSGGWGMGSDRDPGGTEAATSFAILFLLRTTQKAIGEIKEATNTGGYGLGDVASVGVVDGKVVDKSQVTSVEDALALLETNKEGSAEDSALANRIVLDVNPTKRKAQLNRFARMLGGGNSFSARRLGAKILGRGDDLDFVPDLIYALGDGDPVVQRTAERSLKILSRRMNTNYLPLEGPINADNRVKAERAWKDWYLSVRPGHVFADSQGN